MNSNYDSNKVTNPGKFIVIEGTDSSGKNTQTTLLVKHLQRIGINIEKMSFPQYETPFGEFIAKYLRGEYGSLNEVTVEIPCMLYALDRYFAKKQIVRGLKSGKWFIADRFTQSNLAHQGAKLMENKQKQLLTWIEVVESRLPQPDLIIYLHVPAEVAQKLMVSRKQKNYMVPGQKLDIHEQDLEYQKRVVDLYLRLSNERENWVVIDCVNELTNDLENIEIIHHRLSKVVEERFGLKYYKSL